MYNVCMNCLILSDCFVVMTTTTLKEKQNLFAVAAFSKGKMVNSSSSMLMRCWDTVPYYVINESSKRNFTTNSVFSIVVAVGGALLNAAFLITVAKHKRFRQKISAILLINLACIDFTNCIASTLLHGINMALLSRGEEHCALQNLAFLSGTLLSSFSFTTLNFISIETYIAIVYPFIYENKLTLWHFLVPLWTLCILETCCCILMSRYLLWNVYKILITILVVLCVLFFLLAYIHIYRIVNKMRRRVSCVSSEEKKVRAMIDWKTIKTSSSIVLTFILCFLPVGVYYIFSLTTRESNQARTYVETWIQTIRLSNSLLNVFVYYWRLSDVKKASMLLFLPCFMEKIDLKKRKESYLRKVSTTSRNNALPFYMHERSHAKSKESKAESGIKIAQSSVTE